MGNEKVMELEKLSRELAKRIKRVYYRRYGEKLVLFWKVKKHWLQCNFTVQNPDYPDITFTVNESENGYFLIFLLEMINSRSRFSIFKKNLLEWLPVALADFIFCGKILYPIICALSPDFGGTIYPYICEGDDKYSFAFVFYSNGLSIYCDFAFEPNREQIKFSIDVECEGQNTVSLRKEVSRKDIQKEIELCLTAISICSV